MTTATAERRRSDRIWLTIPVRAEGVDTNGITFESEGRATSLSRHGARVQIPRALRVGQAIRLKSPDGQCVEDFRVVASMVLAGQHDGEYGVECCDKETNFWGIEFPDSDHRENEDAKILLECRKCNTLSLLPLTLSEVEAVRAMGWVGKHCEKCANVSLWKYAQLGVIPERAMDASQKVSARRHDEGRSTWITSMAEPIERGHRRVYVLMPLEVRDSQGNREITRTENISKGGFCFSSEKQYRPLETVTAVFPHEAVAQNTELPARIVREQTIEGSDRKIYGAAYYHA